MSSEEPGTDARPCLPARRKSAPDPKIESAFRGRLRQPSTRASTCDRRAIAARARHEGEDRQLRNVSSGDYAAPLVLRGLFVDVDFLAGCLFVMDSTPPRCFLAVMRSIPSWNSTSMVRTSMGSGKWMVRKTVADLKSQT